MKQVWIKDDIHELLIKEAGRRMAIDGKRKPLGKTAEELIVEAINNSKPDIGGPKGGHHEENPKTDNKTPSKNAFDFSALDM